MEMTRGEMAELMLARERLNGQSLLAAVDFYLKNAALPAEPILLVDLVTRFIDARKKAGRSFEYTKQLSVTVGAFARSLPLKKAHEITRADVERWLHGNEWSARTQNGYLGDVRTFFNRAVKDKIVAQNPCDGIEKITLGEAEIEIVSVSQCAALLKMCLSAEHKPLLGFVALGLFCGLRPHELQRSGWSEVNLKGRTVIVMGKRAKSRRRRVVDISVNACAWLRRADRTGAICPDNFQERWKALRRDCGWTARGGDGARPWPHDGMRHTYATMHYAMHQDERLLQAQMGHESDEMLHRHYRALATKVDAVKFWKLRPGRKGKG